MSKAQRAQVVELLRCAADLHFDSRGGLTSIGHDEPEAWTEAYLARNAVLDDIPLPGFDALLEAAARVEEGSYP